MKFILKDEPETIGLGAKIANVLSGGEVIYLRGELGAGKTTLVRGILNALGHIGNVKSPTYTLIEPYSIADIDVYHFDLYRVNDPEELEAMGIRDYFDGKSICLFEWPEQGGSVIPVADITISLAHVDSGRLAEIGQGTEMGREKCESIKSLL